MDKILKITKASWIIYHCKNPLLANRKIVCLELNSAPWNGALSALSGVVWYDTQLWWCDSNGVC